MKKVILVTGASSGIGLACASALQEKGHIVYGSTRDLQRMKAVSFKPIELDVTDDTSVRTAIQNILQAEDRIDVLVNNAGNCIVGPAYAMPVAMAQKQFEVNFFGIVRICNAVLPGMIANEKGLIVNMGSLAGLMGLPYQSMYVASKYALEGYTQSLRMELRSTGVKVVILNPGDFNTPITQNREKVPFTMQHAALEKAYQTVIANIEKHEGAAASPAVIGARLCKIVAAANPSHRYLIGQIGQTIVPLLKQILPGRWFDKLMNDYYGIK